MCANTNASKTSFINNNKNPDKVKTNVFQPRKLDPASKSVYKTLRDSNSNASKAKHIYRYMDMETAIQCIKNENIKFCEPSAWRDKYEGWYYLADYSNITSKNLTHPKLFAFCASTKPVSEAAWNAYKSTEKYVSSHFFSYNSIVKTLRMSNLNIKNYVR